ncbi:hypothetical protein MASSI9I_20018 [Massilia sp. 9I]|nr:hypothetical protein MASSI9I_20018 [Massilia sp. 9I]
MMYAYAVRIVKLSFPARNTQRVYA